MYPEVSTSSTHSFFWRFEKQAKLRNHNNSESSLGNVWLSWCNSVDDLPKMLFKPFIVFNTTLPSSAPVERLFLLGKRVMSPLQNQIGNYKFEKMVMLLGAKDVTK